MENKYYIPVLEDVCLGFECEILWPIGWVKTILDDFSVTHYGDGTITDISWQIHINNLGVSSYDKPKKPTIRCKYLDREDIESLGWKEYNINWGKGKEESYYIGESKSYTFSNTTLTRKEDKWIISLGEYSSMYFFIKNKSELARLMKQLNIQ